VPEQQIRKSNPNAPETHRFQTTIHKSCSLNIARALWEPRARVYRPNKKYFFIRPGHQQWPALANFADVEIALKLVNFDPFAAISLLTRLYYEPHSV
jgi:hypothetical protein